MAVRPPSAELKPHLDSLVSKYVEAQRNKQGFRDAAKHACDRIDRGLALHIEVLIEMGLSKAQVAEATGMQQSNLSTFLRINR